MQPRLESDVRSAKARGIVPQDWPARQPLTIELEQRLRAAQGIDYAATNDTAEDLPIDDTDGPEAIA